MAKRPRQILWLIVQMPDGVTYKIPAKKISNDPAVLKNKDKLLEAAKTKTWHEIRNYAQVINVQRVEGDLWQSIPKEVEYE